MAARLRTRAIALLKQLDERNAPYRALIERELASRVAKPRSGSASSAAAAIRAPGATERAVTDEPSGACGCGTRNDPDARFCKSCGTRLEAA